MGLGIWFTEDIRNALLAANEASAATAQVAFLAEGIAGEDYLVALQAYQEGYMAALSTIALAFGLSPQIIEASSPHINVYDEHETLLVGSPPTELGA